jgi:hypothetical protein
MERLGGTAGGIGLKLETTFQRRQKIRPAGHCRFRFNSARGFAKASMPSAARSALIRSPCAIASSRPRSSCLIACQSGSDRRRVIAASGDQFIDPAAHHPRKALDAFFDDVQLSYALPNSLTVLCDVACFQLGSIYCAPAMQLSEGGSRHWFHLNHGVHAA